MISIVASLLKHITKNVIVDIQKTHRNAPKRHRVETSFANFIDYSYKN